VRFLAQTYIWIFRGIPVLVVLMFVFYGFPTFGVVLSPFVAGVIGMSITSTAYEAEIFRAGLNAVPLGQAEAGHAIGMARIQVFRRVVLPQAWRISVPPYINQAIIIVQSSAQVSVIAVADITMNATLIYSANFKPVIVLGTAAVLYLFLSSVLNVGQRLIERRLMRYSIV
jgi:ABC-type amino acid transport system permease subunit